MTLKSNIKRIKRKTLRLAAVAAAAMLAGCGATANIAEQQVAGQLQQTAETAQPATQTGESDAEMAFTALLSGLLTPGDTVSLTPETALGIGGFTARQRAELDDFCAQQPGNFSVYAQDLVSGSVYSYNTGAAYYPASLLKAAYALWLCTLDDAGEIHLDTSIPNLFMWELADETLQQYNATAMLPAREALQEMISVSDNDSTTMLANVWPATEASGFAEFLRQLGFAQPESCIIDVHEGILGNMTVMDAAASMVALYNYFESDAANADFLQQCFLQADHEMLYVPENLQAAKKYGSWQSAYHDAVIVYAPYPYIICCMTDQGSETVDFPPAPTAAMQALGDMVYRYLNA